MSLKFSTNLNDACQDIKKIFPLFIMLFLFFQISIVNLIKEDNCLIVVILLGTFYVKRDIILLHNERGQFHILDHAICQTVCALCPTFEELLVA